MRPHSLLVRAVIPLAALAMAISGCGSSNGVPDRPLAGPAAPGPGRAAAGGPALDPHPSRIALGALFPDGATRDDIQAYTDLTGKPPAIVEVDQSWQEPLYYAQQKDVIEAAHAIPVITWDPVLGSGQGAPLSSIAAGDYDDYLRQSAAQARAWRTPLYIRFAHEMNLPAAPFGPGRDGNTPAGFVAAWRHVVEVFEQAGATNVRWIWSPNVYCSGNCPFSAYYPGDRWVDWVALDGYNYSVAHGTDWLSFADVFGDSYRLVEQLTSKPMIIAETGSVEQGGDKAAWIRDGLLHVLPVEFPRVRAVVWWERRTAGDGDLRIESSPASVSAFRAAAQSPLYAP